MRHCCCCCRQMLHTFYAKSSTTAPLVAKTNYYSLSYTRANANVYRRACVSICQNQFEQHTISNVESSRAIVAHIHNRIHSTLAHSWQTTFFRIQSLPYIHLQLILVCGAYRIILLSYCTQMNFAPYR